MAGSLGAGEELVIVVREEGGLESERLRKREGRMED